MARHGRVRKENVVCTSKYIEISIVDFQVLEAWVLLICKSFLREKRFFFLELYKLYFEYQELKVLTNIRM